MPTAARAAPDPLPAQPVTGACTPEVALRRVAYLLDRHQAPPRKSQAFLRAAAVVAETAPDELTRRAGDGSLTELAGIGPSTAAVIADAVAGVVPARVAELEDTAWLEPSAPARALLDATVGDCHLHSTWSDGGAPIAEMARTAAHLGHRWIVLTDHSPRLTIAHGLSQERLAEQLDEVRSLQPGLAPFRLLTGVEVDILEDGSLDLPDEVLGSLDLVVASAHSKLKMDERAMTERLVRAVSNPHVDVLGHCTGRLVDQSADDPEADDPRRPPSTFDAELVLHACAAAGTAVEVNCRPERLDPPDPLLAMAVAAGCWFALDSDAHAPAQLEWQLHGAEKAARVGVPPDRLLTSLSADELLAWTERPAADLGADDLLR